MLVIHSGGDSKRVLQYSALGKLFSPVPHKLPDGRSSTLFDEFLIAMPAVPGRIREGMLLLSGDVLLLFNPVLIDWSGSGAVVISFKEAVDTGKNHGVYLRGEDGNVRQFLHKQSIETLRAVGAVNETGMVDIDTGAILLGTDLLDSLFMLISKNGTTDELNSRFALIYTGQRRLPRNLIRDVVGRYIGNDPDTVYALNEIQCVAALMRFELERGNVDAFAELLDSHWKLSKMIDAGSTNTLIDQIFDSVDDLLDGRLVCGAGGAGFLQVILKKGVGKRQLQERIKDVFSDTDIKVWDCQVV